MSLNAYHFVGKTLRNGQPIPPDGEWLEYDGPLPVIMCERGLHGSIDPFDALQYAPGNTLCRVRLGGTIIQGDDKCVATRRKIVARVNAEPMLRAFARRCALDVIHRWDAPPVVVQYLTTGDESLRAAAGAAAWAAARAAARDTAWDTAGAAAWASAGAAARAAAWDTARDTAWAAAWDTAWAAAWAAARAAAWAAQKMRFSGMVEKLFLEDPHGRE